MRIEDIIIRVTCAIVTDKISKTRDWRVRDTDAPAKWFWSQIRHVRDIHVSVNLVDIF